MYYPTNPEDELTLNCFKKLQLTKPKLKLSVEHYDAQLNIAYFCVFSEIAMLHGFKRTSKIRTSHIDRYS